jgi:hypothetical protein
VWKKGDNNPYKAPNAIPINTPFDQAEAGVPASAVDPCSSEWHHQVAPAAAASSVSSLVDEIKRLAESHASSALTDEEFTAFKARLLVSEA